MMLSESEGDSLEANNPLNNKPLVRIVNIGAWMLILLLIQREESINTAHDMGKLVIASAGVLYGILIGFNAYTMVPSFSLTRFSLFCMVWIVGFANLLLSSSTMFLPTICLMIIGSAYLLQHLELISRPVIALLASLLSFPFYGYLVPMYLTGHNINESYTLLFASIIIGTIHGFVFTAEFETIDTETEPPDLDQADLLITPQITTQTSASDLFYDDDEDDQRQTR